MAPRRRQRRRRQHVKFFVVPEGDEHQELREISALWRSPSQRHAAADLWSHSAESVLTALLRQVEPLAPPAADDDEPAAAATPNSDLERNASAAAERRRRAAARDAQAAKAAAAAASTSDAASSNSRSGGRLRASLLFFHGILNRSARPHASPTSSAIRLLPTSRTAPYYCVEARYRLLPCRMALPAYGWTRVSTI